MRAGGVPGRRSAWERACAGEVLVAFMFGAGRGLGLSGQGGAFQGAAGRAGMHGGVARCIQLG